MPIFIDVFHEFYGTAIVPTFIDIVPFLINIVPTNNLFLFSFSILSVLETVAFPCSSFVLSFWHETETEINYLLAQY